MKRNTFYFALILLPFISILSISFSNGGSSSSGVSGSPLDNQLVPQSCLGCHDNNGNFNTSVNITSNIPSGGYALGQIYNITVTQSSTGASKHGFQITVENETSKVGGFGILDPVNTQLQAGANFVTHTFSGTDQTTWGFTWTAPATDVGAITFYVASIAGNLNSSGGVTVNNNQMAQSTLSIGSVLAINSVHLLQFNMYPNPSSELITIQLPPNVNQSNIKVYDYLGKTLIQKNINPTNNTVDISNLSPGIYFVKIQSESRVGTKKLIVK